MLVGAGVVVFVTRVGLAAAVLLAAAPAALSLLALVSALLTLIPLARPLLFSRLAHWFLLHRRGMSYPGLAAENCRSNPQVSLSGIIGRMPRARVPLLLVLAVTAAGCGATKHVVATVAARSTVASVPWWQTEPVVQYGFVKSLTPLGSGYKLRLDLGLLFTVDKTGLAACIDNHDCAAGTKSFPDDTYGRDLRYVVTYYVAPNTPVDLVGLGSATPHVTARYLYGMSQGRNPQHVKAMATGRDTLRVFAFYVEVSRVAPSGLPYKTFEPVLRMAQIYHP